MAQSATAQGCSISALIRTAVGLEDPSPLQARVDELEDRLASLENLAHAVS